MFLAILFISTVSALDLVQFNQSEINTTKQIYLNVTINVLGNKTVFLNRTDNQTIFNVKFQKNKTFTANLTTLKFNISVPIEYKQNYTKNISFKVVSPEFLLKYGE